MLLGPSNGGPKNDGTRSHARLIDLLASWMIGKWQKHIPTSPGKQMSIGHLNTKNGALYCLTFHVCWGYQFLTKKHEHLSVFLCFVQPQRLFSLTVGNRIWKMGETAPPPAVVSLLLTMAPLTRFYSNLTLWLEEKQCFFFKGFYKASMKDISILHTVDMLLPWIAC